MLSVRRRLAGLAIIAAVTFAGIGIAQGTAQASPTDAAATAEAKPTPVRGTQAKPALDPKTTPEAKAMAPKGDTKLLKVGPSGAPPAGLSWAGNNSNVDFSTFYNYCQGSLVYTTVRNWSAATQYYQIVLYANGHSRTLYTSVAANSYAYPAWYGVTGSYTAYMYVWNGSSYAYDEYKSGTLTCSVTVSPNFYPGYTGYILYTIKNNGTAYATVETNELAPYPTVASAPSGYGAYVGRHIDYPAAGGGTIYRYVYVGTGLKFGVYNNLYGANGYSPWYWYGSL